MSLHADLIAPARHLCQKEPRRPKQASLRRCAPALDEFALFEGRALEPEQLLPVLRNRAVRRASAGFGNGRKYQRFVTLRAESGKAELDPWAPFEYQ